MAKRRGGRGRRGRRRGVAAQRVSCTIRHFTPVVINQGEEWNCSIIQFTDMISTAFRMSGHMVLLSPQSLLNAGYDSTRTIRFGLAVIGLYEQSTMPFATIRIAPTPETGNENHIIIPGERVYRVGLDSRNTPGAIKRAILANFGPEGPHHPLSGSLLMGDLEDSDVAVHAYDFMPFRHEAGREPVDDGERDLHVLLIVGVDTTYEDPRRHFCLVKNCWGEDWGKGGFTKVGFEVFLELDIPILGDDVGSLITTA